MVVYGFSSSVGMLYDTYLAYTPQRNGVYEHKNHHTLDISWTLLFQSQIVKTFLSIVVLTSFLINNQPSTVHHNDTFYLSFSW